MIAEETCPICGGRLALIVPRVDRYSYYSCEGCELVTSLPKPTPQELSAFYDGFLFGQPQDAAGRGTAEQALLEDVERIWADIRRTAGTSEHARLLDWGGGTGFYANAFSRLGLRVTLVDIDRQACGYAAAEFPNRFKIINADPTRHRFEETFDVVFCNQVIEHYVDLNGFLERARGVLVPGGVLIITTPNQQCKEFYFRPRWAREYVTMARVHPLLAVWRFLRTPWICCDPPRHLYAFNRKSLASLLRKNDFEPLACFTEYLTRQYYSTPRLRPNWGVERLRSLARIVLEFYTYAGIELLWRLDGKRRWGNNLVVYARPLGAGGLPTEGLPRSVTA